MNILIGDVHGCIKELKALWAKLPLPEAEQIIFLGDLIDYGPDSAGVLDFVFQAKEDWPISIVQGNHELKVLRQIKHNRELPFEVTPERMHVLQSAIPFYTFEKDHYLAVHGGLFPALIETYKTLPDLKKQSQWDKKLRQRIERTSICGYVNPEGNIVSRGQESEKDHFWADNYQGQWGFVFYGHHPSEEIQTHPFALGLDTACVYGGALSAALVNHGEIRLLQQRAFHCYAKRD